MAAPQNGETASDPKDLWVRPALLFLKSIVLFLDVATLMLRLLANTLVYDSPLGKSVTAPDRGGTA